MARDKDRKRSESGEYTTEITPDDVLRVFAAVDGPTIMTSDVTDELDCSSPTARRKLDELYDQGRVKKRTIARRTLWWQPESPEQTLKQLSQELNEPIVVGDMVYEDGDQHAITDADAGPDDTAEGAGER